MIPKRIEGATHNLVAPKGWDSVSAGHCAHLAVRQKELAGAVLCESAWEPTPDELAALNAGGSVVLM